MLSLGLNVLTVTPGVMQADSSVVTYNIGVAQKQWEYF